MVPCVQILMNVKPTMVDVNTSVRILWDRLYALAEQDLIYLKMVCHVTVSFISEYFIAKMLLKIIRKF